MRLKNFQYTSKANTIAVYKDFDATQPQHHEIANSKASEDMNARGRYRENFHMASNDSYGIRHDIRHGNIL